MCFRKCYVKLQGHYTTKQNFFVPGIFWSVLHPFEIPSFNEAENPVKHHGNDTQNDDGHQDPGELEEACTHSDCNLHPARKEEQILTRRSAKKDLLIPDKL